MYDRSVHVDLLLERRFPGLIDEVERRARQLVKQMGAEEWDDRVLDVLEEEFDLDIRDTENSSAAQAFEKTADEGRRLQVREWMRAGVSYRIALEEMPREQLSALYHEATRSQTAEREARNERDAFYNDVKAKANLESWTNLALWSIEEAVALSFGKDPKVVSIKELQGVRGLPPFKRNFLSRVDALNRSVIARQLADPVTPSILVELMLGLRWEIPQLEFLTGVGGGTDQQVVALTAQISSLQSELDDLKKRHEKYFVPTDRMSTRRPGTLYRIILAVAKGKYRWPENRSAITNMISDIDRAGLSMDAETLGSVLVDAEEWRDGKPKSDSRSPKSVLDPD